MPPRLNHTIVLLPGKIYLKHVKKAQRWIVGDGCLINLWSNQWLGNFSVKEYVDTIPTTLENLTVNKIINRSSKTWNLNKISHLCPDYILNRIIATPIPCAPTKDKFVWAYTPNGSFGKLGTSSSFKIPPFSSKFIWSQRNLYLNLSPKKNTTATMGTPTYRML